MKIKFQAYNTLRSPTRHATQILMMYSGIFLFLGLFAGRCLGLLREIVLAGKVGAGASADAVIALVTLPDIVVSILIGNALSAVFIPIIKNLKSSQRLSYFYKLSAKIGIFIFVVTCIASYQIDFLAKLLLPTGSSNHEFAAQLQFVLWAIPAITLSTVSRVFLQAENKFTLLGLENVIFNSALIIGILAYAQNPSFSAITAAVLIGSLLRWILQTTQVLLIYRNENNGDSPPIKWSYMYSYSFALITGIIMQTLPIYGRSIASFFEKDGALSAYNYAYKFIEFPMALGISVISTIIFPKLSELAISKNTSHHNELIKKSQEFIVNLCLPAAILVPLGLYLLAGYDLSFKNIPRHNLEVILKSISIGFLALLIRGLNELNTVVLNSIDDVKSPLYSTILASLIGGVGVFYLTKLFGLYGTFWGLNISFIINWLSNIYFLKGKGVNIISLMFTPKNFKTLLATLLSCSLIIIAKTLFPLSISFLLWTICTFVIYSTTLGSLVIKQLKESKARQNT